MSRALKTQHATGATAAVATVAARRDRRARNARPSGLGRRLLRQCLPFFFVATLLSLVVPTLLPTRKVEAQDAGAAVVELIPAGSLVIPMDNTLQALVTPFNLKAYGTVERLLWAGIPVKWAIATGKAKDGVDFSATARRLYPSASAASVLNFSGGPFIVHRDLVVAARTAISAYATSNNVVVYETTADAMVSIRHTLTHRPKVAVFDDGGSADIHTDYLDAAGFIPGTHYNIIPAATLVTVNASACFTIGTEPHWTATGTAADPQVNAIRQFVQSGGNFLAECDGIATYENNVTYGRFQTTTGMATGNARTGIQYPSPDLPYSQFVGAMADVGGSVRDFQPVTGGAYRAGAEMHAQSGSGSIGGNASILPAKGSVARLSGTSLGGFVFYLGGHQYTTGDLGNVNGIRMYLNAVMTPTSRPSNCNLTLTPRTISGTIYEDINGDSNLADGVTRPGVAVRLYQDVNNNGLVDAGDTFLVASTTDASGQYSFQIAPQSTGNNYLVAVDSKGVSPSATLIAGRGDAWAEQTYGDNPATAAFDLGSRFGGRQSGASDNYNASSTAAASNSYEHLARVDVSASNIADANFGFSFNVVTNTRAGDTVDDDAANTSRTVQGSLRQFIQNANAINGANYMRFVPAVAANAGTYWQVSVTSALAAISDPATTIDGTAYSNSNGTTQLDTNAGALGVGGTVGVDSVSLSQVGRPELEVVGSAAIAVGLDLQASNSTVRRIALRGFGSTANNDNSANIRIGNNFTTTLIEQNFLGVVASAATFSTSAATSTGDNIRSAGADSGTIRNNLIGFSSGKGIQLGGGTLGGTSTGWLVENNEVRYNGIGNANLDGIDIENGSGNCTVRGNLLVANEGAGVDMYMSSGGNTIENNTITGNGIGAGANIESPGVRVYGASSTFSRNVINANFGAGIMVTSNASGNILTRNSIFANGTITNKGGAAASNQIGIDLLSAANNQLTGTSPYVTVNDNGDTDSGGNGLSNFPVITSARVLSGNLVLQGYARPGASLELFIAAPDPSGFGEGQTYLLTLVEGSAADEQATTGTYTSPVGGLTVGTDTTNLFKFTIPLPAGVAVGTTLTATATGGEGTSEFSGNIVIAAAPPEVKLEKRCTAPANCEDDAQQPGTELTYTITFTNTAGTSPAQGLTIIDIIPITDTTTSIIRNTEFKVGSMTFNPGTSTLSIVPTDYKYYNDPLLAYPLLPPWTPSSAYTPSGAFDYNVTYVGWKLTGTMPPGTSGSVSFTVRIR